MKRSVTAMCFRWNTLIALLCVLPFVGCKSAHKSETEDMRESVALPLTAAYEDRFAISPDGTKVVHAPTDVSAGDRERRRPFEVRTANTSGVIAEVDLPIEPAISYQVNSIQFCDYGKYLLVGATLFYDPDHPPQSVKPRGPNASVDSLRIVDTKSYTLHTDISLSAVESDIPQQVLAQPHRAYELGGDLRYLVCAANSPIAVAVIGHTLHLNAIKAFNLETGSEVPGSGDLLLQSDVLGVAISPEATSLALFGPRDAQNTEDSNVDYQITIVDLRTKKVAREIWSKSPFNFNVIKFAGESTIAIEIFDQKQYELPSDSWTGPQAIFRTRASIHFFDVGSGADLRMISRPDNGEFRLLDFSADGRTMLVRTDSDHFCFSCNGGGGQEVITDSRFTLWNPQTGNPIDKSPSLKVVHHRCWLPRWLSSGGGIFGNCIAFDEEPELELSQGGNAVAALWRQGDQPILVYSLPSH